jgi:Ni,Fe-hydrogenase III small subunit/ferredoxin
MPWILRGLREGVVTTHYPRRPDDYGEEFRGAVRVLDASRSDRDADPREGHELAAVCPTGAITAEPVHPPTVRVDRGRCILCGHCVAQRPDRFGFVGEVELADVSPHALVVPDTAEGDEVLRATRAALHRRVRSLRRSIHIRHVDAGSDGAEEAEIAALTGPIYDVQRLGMFFTASPRHADILLVTGVGTAGMAKELRRTHDAMPDPKIVVAAGADAISGGMVGTTYASAGGIGALLPVDVFVPGSPPSPFSLLHGLLLAVGLLPRGAAR